ncbi:MAG TPA: NAD(P)-dependent oxidoreductase [bacterium]|nr:NAD(P)-dependent oxidoreductase [bacterium]
MNIFVTGGSGPLGHRVLKALVRNRHQVTAAATNPEETRWARQTGARPLKVNLFNLADTQVATIGQDVIINLTGGLGPGTWKKAHAARRAVSLSLVHAALKNRPSRFIEESSFRIYRDHGLEEVGEEGALRSDPVAYSIQAMERNVLELGKAGPVPVVLRMAEIYSADDSRTRRLLRWARLGYFAEMDPAPAYLPRVHADDAAAAVVHALRATAGVWNVCEDQPLPRSKSARLLAEAMGRRELFKPPFWMARLAAPAEPSRESLNLSNRRFKTATGWRPAYPSAKEGWGALLEQAAR